MSCALKNRYHPDKMQHHIALIGAGKWGKNLARVFSTLGVLDTVCDPDPRIRAADVFRGALPRFSDNVEAVIADPSITAVAIATPSATHARLARAAILSGKDVFVEKPMALSIPEGEELVALAEEHGRILMVGHLLQYHPAVRTLQRLVREGAVGNLQYIQSHRLNLSSIRHPENVLWRFAPHDVSLLLSLLHAMPQEIMCQGVSCDRSTTDITLSQFQFAKGVQAHIYVNWLFPQKQQQLVVIGERGALMFDGTAAEPLTLQLFNQHAASAPLPPNEQLNITREEPLLLECRHFLDCLISRRAPLTDGYEGLAVLRVLHACQRSLETGRSVRLEKKEGIAPLTYA